MDPTVIAALLSLAGSTIGTFAGILAGSQLTEMSLPSGTLNKFSYV